MGLNNLLNEKREWLNFQKRVDLLPPDYKIVYHEIQKYFFKVGPEKVYLENGPLYEIVNMFEAGAKNGLPVLEVTGEDVASFADGMIEGMPTIYDQVNESVTKSLDKAFNKQNKKS